MGASKAARLGVPFPGFNFDLRPEATCQRNAKIRWKSFKCSHLTEDALGVDGRCRVLNRPLLSRERTVDSSGLNEFQLAA